MAFDDPPKATDSASQDPMSKSTAWIKRSLTFPKSTFEPRPLRPGSERCQQFLKSCTEDIYIGQQRNRKDAPTFTLHDGPPYANGDLHIGHALNKILKDITCRFQLTQGKRVTWVPGWDCHGLPIELKALEKEKADAADGVVKEGESQDGQKEGNVTRALKIRKLARDLASSTVEKQQEQFQQWGIMANWANRWRTMDQDFEIKQLEVFKKMVEKDLIYRQFKPVYWSSSTRTALAEAELEYQDNHRSTAAYVKFPLVIDSDKLGQKLGGGVQEVKCVIRTTMPWTLPANRAIGFNTRIPYVVLKSEKHGHLLVAQARASDLAAQLEEKLSEVTSLQGHELEGVEYVDSTWSDKPQTRRLLHADHVTADAGTGLAHLAPGHGPDDYSLCIRHGIEPFAPVSEDGTFNRSACPRDPDLLAGKDVMTVGNAAALKHIDEVGLLIKSHKYRHRYPYDWRSKKPIILRATAQWFANVGQLQENAVQALSKTKFIPHVGQNRLKAFVRNRNEWCISRQRAWGVPIPSLYHKETGEPLMTVSTVEHIISVIKDRGTDAWWSDAEDDPVWTAPSQRNTDGTTSYRRGLDTMDVWFDSGSSWSQTTNAYGAPTPADMYLEGSDQHRGWFQSSLLTYIASQEADANPTAPYRSLVTHGFVLDHKNRKMSKSEGNVVSPSQVMDGSLLPPLRRKFNGKTVVLADEMGSDALRLWVASCDFTSDVSLSPVQLKNVNSALSKYRVTFKHLLGLLCDKMEEPSADAQQSELALHHRIVLLQTQNMQHVVQKHYEALEYHKVVEEINRYINVDLSALWFEAIKDDAYCGIVAERRDVQTIVLYILRVLARLIEPLTPLMIVEVWFNAPYHLRPVDLKFAAQDAPAPSATREGLLDEQDYAQIGKDLPSLLAIRDAIHSCQERARTDKKMGSALECSVHINHSAQPDSTSDSNSAADFFARYGSNDLARLMAFSDVMINSETPEAKAHEWSYHTKIQVEGSEVIITVVDPQYKKCNRCWKYVVEVKSKQEYGLCQRCEGVVKVLMMDPPTLGQRGIF